MRGCCDDGKFMPVRGNILWEWFAASIKRSRLRRCLQCNKDVNIGVATMSDEKLRFWSNLVGRVLSERQLLLVLLDGFSAFDWDTVDKRQGKSG